MSVEQKARELLAEEMVFYKANELKLGDLLTVGTALRAIKRALSQPTYRSPTDSDGIGSKPRP